MATFIWIPDYGLQEAHKPRVRVVQFGDGYQQRSADGINTDAETYQLTFSNRADTEADLIEAFLEARGALENFDWTPPRGTVARKFVCPEWSASPPNFGVRTITARFVRVFES